MSIHDHQNPDDRAPGADALDAGLPDSLRWQLRALRRDETPATDLWPGIAPRLTTQPLAAPRPRQRWLAPVALAASLLLVVGAVGLWQRGEQAPARPAFASADHGQAAAPSPTTAVVADATRDRGLAAEAEGMHRQYQAAIRELAPRPVPASLAPVLNDLDRNAALILDALNKAPDSPQLLDQLRRTYDRRIDLMRRAYI